VINARKPATILSPNVADFLVSTFDIKPIDTVATDVAAMLAGN